MPTYEITCKMTVVTDLALYETRVGATGFIVGDDDCLKPWVNLELITSDGSRDLSGDEYEDNGIAAYEYGETVIKRINDAMGKCINCGNIVPVEKMDDSDYHASDCESFEDDGCGGGYLSEFLSKPGEDTPPDWKKIASTIVKDNEPITAEEVHELNAAAGFTAEIFNQASDEVRGL